MSVHVLVIGSGGREHALTWKLAQSPRIGKLYVAPGNGGTGLIAKNVPIEVTNTEELIKFAKEHEIGLTVVGPDDPLALGIVDAFTSAGLRVFGPTKGAAQIEASKAFSKELMSEAGIPTAAFEVFSEHAKALEYLRHHDMPVVVKASGLALGKGVYVCRTLQEAETALSEIMLERVHKDAGAEVVIEEFLTGPEVSIHAFCDGKTAVLLPTAQDHKPIGEGDTGKNTGGMGTVAPIPWVDQKTLATITKEVVQPTLAALAKRKHPFSGLLFPGLMLTDNGVRVLEFNARFGDPETQSYVRLLKTDLLDILEACVDGTLSECTIEWESRFAACVVLASGGYPDAYEKGFVIDGLEEAEKQPEVVVFHAGTTFDGSFKTSGGRVLGVTALGDTLDQALERAYGAVKLIQFEGMQYRTDIGAKVLAKMA